jgi:hypothetical protein
LKGKRSASKVGQSGLFRNLKAVYFVIFTSPQALRLNRRALKEQRAAQGN